LPSAWSIASIACAISNWWSSNGRSSKLAAGFVFALIVISFRSFCCRNATAIRNAGCHHTLSDDLNCDQEMCDLPVPYDDAGAPLPSITIAKSGELKIIRTGCFI
jgi:hypothetical protein